MLKRPTRDAGALRLVFVALAGCTAIALAGCANSPTKSASHRPKSKEYFAESAYGVKASPRVSNKRSNLPRGGGRDQIGKPYKVAGKWYYPKEVKNYRKKGTASWYGDAFHGRLTANGEIYDMTHLTAAHPTMPLPSYARVTNLENGNSVIVRVNDRGPFHGNREIDLSRRAAELLDYTRSGTAKVEVQYVGRAPLHGRDDQFLMASYQPGGRGAPHPGDNIATGVMIAMNGDTPTRRGPDMPVMLASAAPSRPAALPGVAAEQPAQVPFGFAETTTTTAAMAFPADPVLPDLGPLVPERPPFGYMVRHEGGLPVMSYADSRIAGATAAVNAFAESGLTADAIQSSWKRTASVLSGEHIAVGTFATEADAQQAARRIGALGQVVVAGGSDGFTVDLYPGKQGQNMDHALEQVWALGLTDAMTIRR